MSALSGAAANAAAAPDAPREHGAVTVHKSAKGPTIGTTTGSVVVVMTGNGGGSGKGDIFAAQQYKPGAKDERPGGGNDTLKNGAYFLAVLAPNADAAIQFLSNRPAGAHLLVKDEDGNLAVYIKFRQAVRAIVLVKAKELKKQEEPIEWGRPYRPPPSQNASSPPQTHSTMMTPVHKIYLAAELYMPLEQCWKRFLPQVKAILLQMCCEPYLDEDAKLDDWGAAIAAAQSPCVVVLVPQTCGFYLLRTSNNALPSSLAGFSSNGNGSGSGPVPVRHVEFDFQKFVMVVADGTFNPTAFIVQSHFSSKRMLDADVTFKLLRDNFLSPDRVMLKETTVATLPAQQSMWQSCVELNSADPEFTLLATLQRVCWGIIPHEPLPDLFLDSLRNLHLLFVTSYDGESSVVESASHRDSCPPTWPKEKIRMASQIFPYLLEMMVAAASGLESIEASANTAHGTLGKAHADVLYPKQKLKLLNQFARVLRFDIVHMINRCDEAMLFKFAHHIFQFYSMRCDLPAEFIELIRDLLAVTPEFRSIFVKNQGTNLLWKALHTGDRFPLSSSMPGGISPLAQALFQSNVDAAAPKAAHERRSSLFGIGKKTQPKARTRKSVDFGSTFAIPVMSSVKPLVFLRINPLLVQSELISKLCRGQLEVSHQTQETNCVGAKYAFCYCPLVQQRVAATESQAEICKTGHHLGIYTSCKRKKRTKLSPKMCMYELVLQLSLEFQFSSSARTWERDVGLLLRLENIHESLFTEVVQQMKDAVAMAPEDAMILCPDHALLDQGNYCRLRVVVKCVSDLFRLELKRRNQMKTALGDKKYWYMIHLFRTELREFNDYLEGCTENEDESSGDDEHSEGNSDAPSGDKRRVELLAHIGMFRWIPRNLLDEWIVLSLEDLLQTATVLSVLLERGEASGSTNLEHIQYACQLLQIFCFIMRRSTDIDLQTLFTRLLNRGCFPVVPLLRQLTMAAVTFVDLLDIRTSYTIQTEIVAFLHEFLKLDLALPARNQWAQHSSGAMLSKSEDVEVLEQRKAVLMASTLSSNASGQLTMWEFLVLTMIPKEDVPPSESASRVMGISIPPLSVVHSFHQKLEPPELSANNPFYFRLVESFLLLSAHFYTSLLPGGVHGELDFRPNVSGHMHYLALYNKRYGASGTQDSRQLVRRAAGLHAKCLIALANRRAIIPAITDAFVSLQVLPALFEMVHAGHSSSSSRQPELSAGSATGSEPVPLSHERVSESGASDSAVGAAPVRDTYPDGALDMAQKIAPMLSLKLHCAQTPVPRLDSRSLNERCGAQGGLLLSPSVHALVVILIASFVILEPNFELDEKFCPRFAIAAAASSSEPALQSNCFDMLWSLQQHQTSTKLNAEIYEHVLKKMESSLVIPTAAHASAIRLLIRLASPGVFERGIYVKASPQQARNAENEAGAEKLDTSDATDPANESTCTYVTKGAFSTVYRAVPLLPQTPFVAIKALAHQKRPGDMSVLGNLYNEVAVLKKLQGEPAAIQMLDFGNHHEAQNFEIVMEYCPCTVTEWRATLGPAPFRSLLVMVLRAYEHICQSLARIHREHVGHFDIKGDNVLVRTTPGDLTRRLLLFEERESFESEATRFLNTAFCFGDFGESMIAEADVAPGRTSSFSLHQAKQRSPSTPTDRCFFPSRTRGTEAIKSPEMLKVKGGESQKEKITFATDIWSMGCLLYELLTQELMFGSDDVAGLFTHLVIAEGRVLRDAHERKIEDALKAKGEHEKLFVRRIVALCDKILSRSSKRLSLDQLLAEVRRLLEDILQSSKTTEDKVFMDQTLDNDPSPSLPAPSPKETQEAVASISSLPTLSSRLQAADDSEKELKNGAPKSAYEFSAAPHVAACRFFWNLHVGGITEATTRYYVQALTKAGAGDRATSATTAFMDAFEAAHETTYDHFVYFLWDNDSNARFDSQLPEAAEAAEAAASLVNELSEEDGRTCLFINSEWISLRRSGGTSASQQQQTDWDEKFFRQLDQEAQKLFPVFQRLLRTVPGSVLLLGVGKDSRAMEAMNETLVTMLLFFLQSSFSLGTTEALTFLARDCGQLFGYPKSQRLLELETYAARHEEVLRRVQAREKLVSQRYVAQCLCGESVFAVQLDAIKESMYHLQQQCARSAIHPQAGSSPCFHPFPSPPAEGFEPEGSSEQQCSSIQYDGYPMDSRMVYEVSEERLLFPLEARSRRRDQVSWAEVDIRSIERLDSLFGADLAAANPSTSSHSNSHANASGSGTTAGPLSSRVTQLSSRSSGPLILSFRERKKRWRRQAEEQQQSQLAGVGENAEDSPHNAHCGMITALTFGLKERAYSGGGGVQPTTHSQSSSAPGGGAPKPRKLFECELCCFPICAISSDHEKVAIPLFFGRKAV